MKKMTKPRIAAFYIDIIIIAATLCFIFGNSLESIPESQDTSLSVLDAVKPILEPIVGPENVTDHLVRKLAHFIEFAALGIEALGMCIITRRTRIQNLCNCAFAGLLAAVTDETIQIFSARGSQVQDVLLDYGGYITGAAVMFIIFTASAAVKRRRSGSAGEDLNSGHK